MNYKIDSLYFENEGKPLQVEITSVCNNLCKMCFGQRFNLHPKKHMKFDDFRRVLDIYDPTLLRLVGRGESMIHPEINKFLQEIKDRKIKTTLTTNLNMQNIDYQLFKDTIAETYISLHSYNPETYLKITGKPINNVIANIQKFKELDINFHVKMIVTKYNENEINDFIFKSASLGVYYWISGLDFGVNEVDDNLKQELIKELYPTHDDVKIYSRYKNKDLEIKKYKTCNTAKIPYVLYDGSVYSCCLAAKSGYLGNIFEDDFRIDPSIQKMMQNRKGKECASCPLN